MFRAAFHRLPFTMIPKTIVKILAMECAKKLNFFPPKGGVSPYYSPRMIMHQQSLDYNKHCSIAFGSYVQAHTEPNPQNTQHPRTIDCIYRRYVDNEQGGHQLLDRDKAPYCYSCAYYSEYHNLSSCNGIK
jgi:hypothetical protein